MVQGYSQSYHIHLLQTYIMDCSVLNFSSTTSKHNLIVHGDQLLRRMWLKMYASSAGAGFSEATCTHSFESWRLVAFGTSFPLKFVYSHQPMNQTSLALLDRFFLFVLGWRKKNSPAISANLHFLGVDNCPLMASDKRRRAVNWCE